MHHLLIRAWSSDFFPYAEEHRCRLGGALRVLEDLAEEERILDCLACACAVVWEGLARG